MTEHDPAFLWETAAIRDARRRKAAEQTDRAMDDADEREWVTLREATRVTGVPVETLRKWAKRDQIPSYLAPTKHGSPLRMVDLDGARERAATTRVGREEPVVANPATTLSPSAPTAAPPGSMIVPVDAWNKMLNQLGNLHEAGQQLAAARERAAKAETEVQFLRERLAELRQEKNLPVAAAAPLPEKQATEGPGPSPTYEKAWRYVVKRWQGRRPG